MWWWIWIKGCLITFLVEVQIKNKNKKLTGKLAINMATLNLNFPKLFPLNSPRLLTRPLHCIPVQQQVDVGIMCESCSGKGWLLCEYCKGQKINVKGDNKRLYRRCPSCRAVGFVICDKCKVYKCVTFPDHNDG